MADKGRATKRVDFSAASCAAAEFVAETVTTAALPLLAEWPPRQMTTPLVDLHPQAASSIHEVAGCDHLASDDFAKGRFGAERDVAHEFVDRRIDRRGLSLTTMNGWQMRKRTICEGPQSQRKCAKRYSRADCNGGKYTIHGELRFSKARVIYPHSVYRRQRARNLSM